MFRSVHLLKEKRRTELTSERAHTRDLPDVSFHLHT